MFPVGNPSLRCARLFNRSSRLLFTYGEIHAPRLFSARPFTESALIAAHSLMDGLHATSGLPWVVTIPLAALVVRGVIVTPLMIYSRRVSQRRLDLQPLLLAWVHRFRHQSFEQSKGQMLLPAQLEKGFKRAMKTKQRELYKRWGCQTWRSLPAFGQLPVFLAVIGALRCMCGQSGGLFGLLSRREPLPDDAPRDEVLVRLKETSGSPVGLEESLAHEGGLWFPDLLAPDPGLVLPFVLSGVIFGNVWLGTRRDSIGAPPSAFYRRLSNGLKLSALLIGPLTLQAPSAVLVYWISSSAFAAGQNVLLDRFMPLKPAVPLPKRPGTGR